MAFLVILNFGQLIMLNNVHQLSNPPKILDYLLTITNKFAFPYYLFYHNYKGTFCCCFVCEATYMLWCLCLLPYTVLYYVWLRELGLPLSLLWHLFVWVLVVSHFFRYFYVMFMNAFLGEFRSRYGEKSIKFNFLKYRPVFVPPLSLYLPPLLRPFKHHLHTLIISPIDLLKHRMTPEVFQMPLMKLLNISNTINSSLWFQKIGILGQKASIDNSSLESFVFEMRIRKTHKYLL